MLWVSHATTYEGIGGSASRVSVGRHLAELGGSSSSLAWEIQSAVVETKPGRQWHSFEPVLVLGEQDRGADKLRREKWKRRETMSFH